MSVGGEPPEMLPPGSRSLVVRPDEGELSVATMVSQARKIQECMSAVMKRDEHYGVIPGTKPRKDENGKELPPKPTLLKPGAEKLCLMFRLCPEYETLRADSSPAGIAYTVRCILTHIPTGNRIATGLGSCNSREKKYTRPADKKCPSCGKETIIKGKDDYGGGWLCWAKKGGCNAKFKDGDETIEKQDTGLADPSDLDNTILKMACKRALVAAVLNGTAASDCFTQDLEDLTEKAAEYAPPEPKPDNRAKSVSVTPDDRLADRGQLARIHALRDEIGGMSGTDPRDRYPQMIHGYHQAGGKACEHSNELTETQAAHLIRRMEEMKAKQHEAARSAVESVGQELHDPKGVAPAGGTQSESRQSRTTAASSMSTAGSQGTGDDGVAPTAAALEQLRGEFKRLKFTKGGWAAWLGHFFKVATADALTGDQADTAYVMMASLKPGELPDGTPIYRRVIADLRERGKLPPVEDG